MSDQQKNEANKSASTGGTSNQNKDQNQSKDQNKGSGSDTVSAAKISAGTSVGNVGQSPMPQAAGSTGSGAGASGAGSSGGTGGCGSARPPRSASSRLACSRSTTT